MTDHGAGFVPASIPTPPIATDYSYNWVNISHGEASVPPGLPTPKGGPPNWYLDWGTGGVTEPPASKIKVWDGTAWTTGAKTWDGAAWVPLKVWDGAQWVT